MLRAGLLCCAVVLASCAEPSRPDPSSGSSSKASSAEDPWSGKKGSDAQSKKPDLGGFDPSDLAGSFGKIAEGLSKPGPYEAPDHSAQFDGSKPHWGVLALSGEIVERSGLSWTGSRGTELRTLIDRLRELAN